MDNDLEIRAKKKLKNKRISRTIGLILGAVCITTACIFCFMLIKLAIVPQKYLIFGFALLAVICVYNILSQFTCTHIVGKVFSILMIIVMVIVILYSNKTMNILGVVAGNKTETIDYSVIVKSSNSASSISDIKDYTFTYVEGTNDNEMIGILQNIKEDAGTTINIKTVSNWSDLINSLLNDKTAIVINEAYRTILNEQQEDFSSSSKVIKTYSINKEAATATQDKAVSDESFIVYISGNDLEGKIATIGNSDVNIIAVVNPVSHQILLVTTPRDSYVPIPDNSGEIANDKLTHAGIFGIETSIGVLNKLYSLNIDYYVKTNFTGAVGIVDALGGVTIDSEVSFVTFPSTSPIEYTFNVGLNECDGDMTLAFCRERYAFVRGDFQRGRDQLAAIAGIFNKATSPAIIVNYMSVLDSMTDLFVTNMPQDAITTFVRGILNDMSGWNIQMFSADLNSSQLSAYSRGAKSEQGFVVLDPQTITLVQNMVDKIEAGEVFNVNDYVQSETGKTNSVASPTQVVNGYLD